MKKTLALILALLMILSLCACGSSSKSISTESIAYDQAAPAEAPAAVMMAEEYSADYGGFAASGSNSVAEGQGQLPDSDPAKIIYSADATLESTDFDGAVTALMELVSQSGGWVESSSVNGANYYSISRGNRSLRSAYYVLRIPSEKFEGLMGSLSQIGNVPYTHTYSENVTAQYYDTQARLTAYRTQEESLIAMMAKAETVSDVIAIEEKLTELRYQIEALQSSLNNWDRQVSYSTLNLSLEEVRDYSPEPEQSYLQELWQALLGAFKDLGRNFKSLLVFLVSSIPTLIVLAVLFLVLRPVWKKLKAKRKVKKEDKIKKE